MKTNMLDSTATIAIDEQTIGIVDNEVDVIEENLSITALSTYQKENDRFKYLNLFIKRMIDIVGAIVGIILLIPITIAVAIANSFEKSDKGPIFYTQMRMGKNGKLFKLYKFRTMVVDADKKLDTYLQENEEAREEYKKYKKLKDDPRITKVGRILRKTSLDEWPQFINVLFSQMSLVGPRPYLPKEKDDMKDCFETILEVKPGITGLWQVGGRADVTFEDRMLLDLKYRRDSNIILDFNIIILTIFKVLKKEGAI